MIDGGRTIQGDRSRTMRVHTIRENAPSHAQIEFKIEQHGRPGVKSLGSTEWFFQADLDEILELITQLLFLAEKIDPDRAS